MTHPVRHHRHQDRRVPHRRHNLGIPKVARRVRDAVEKRVNVPVRPAVHLLDQVVVERLHPGNSARTLADEADEAW